MSDDQPEPKRIAFTCKICDDQQTPGVSYHFGTPRWMRPPTVLQLVRSKSLKKTIDFGFLGNLTIDEVRELHAKLADFIDEYERAELQTSKP